MRWPLRYQILFPFAGLFLAVIVLCSALDAYLAVRASQRQIESQLREIARTLVSSSFPLTDAVLRQTRGLSGAEFVVTAPGGAIVAASIPTVKVSPVDEPVQRWEHFRLGKPESIAGEKFLHGAIALNERADRAEPGMLHILYPERVWSEARWQAIYPPVLVGAVALIAVGAVSFALAARLSRPISLLRAQVSRLAAGDFQPVRLPARNDELRDLVESVNTLAGQLDEMQRVIKRSERLTLIGQLSGGLAHHLRNDVAGARMAVQLHQRDYPAADAETLTVALRQLALAEQHLQQFLAAGQPRAPRRTACDLQTIVAELVSLVGPTCKHRAVDLQTRFADDDVYAIHADAEQLRHALLNLVLNAIEAAGPKGYVQVECEASDTRNSLLVRIVDSGEGVPATVTDRLFEPFTTSKPEGVGLGLAVARQIIEAHGGTLQYRRSTVTCFELELPIERPTTLDARQTDVLQSVGSVSEPSSV